MGASAFINETAMSDLVAKDSRRAGTSLRTGGRERIYETSASASSSLRPW
jgi:hypothetical protein